MLRNNHRIVKVAVAFAAAALAVSGVTAASAAAAARPSAARAAVTGTEHFQLVSTSATATTGLVIAYGAFTSHAVDHMGTSVDRFVFAGGSFKVFHSPGSGPQSFNAKTCLLTATIHGTYRVFDGTGRFRGISGHGHYLVTILGIAARSKGACSMSKAPVAYEQTIRASGPIKL
jgi:hypothetical protein